DRAYDCLQEGRLAGSIGANDSQPLASSEQERDFRSESGGTISNGEVVDGKHVVARARDAAQTECAGVVLAHRFHAVQTFELVPARLRLLRLLACDIPPDEVLGFGYHRLLLFVLASLGKPSL